MSAVSRSPAPSVLLVDPNADTADLYASALAAAGFDVHRTGWAQQAEVTPDVAIALMREPDCNVVRNMLGGRRVPTLVLASWVAPGVTPADVDCDVVLMIPVSPEVVVLTAFELLTASPTA